MPNDVLSQAKAAADSLRDWRRYLHANPELSGQERLTAGFLADRLQELGLEARRSIGGSFGLLADVMSGSGPAIALRADMDALPVQEKTGLPFASRNAGVMHACGHDAHMAMLLGAALLLKQNERRLKRPVRLVFQPAEEHAGGAQAMIAGGALDGVGSIFGIHVWSRLPAGVLGTRVGAFMSSVNDFRLLIRGKAGHAAMPEQCIDPVVIAAQVITALQTAVSRSIAMSDSAVVSVTQMQAGSATNIIPESASLEGTIRTLDEAVRDRVCARVREIAAGTAAAHGATADVHIPPGCPALINDARAVEHILAAARRLGWDERAFQTLPAQGGGEDFAYYGQKVPAAFVFLGASPCETSAASPHHNAYFDINEDVLPLGAALLAEIALGG
jgi:amidohydrolase